MCGSLTGQAPEHRDDENERIRLKRTICSTGSKDGADRCIQSKWGEENNVHHEGLEREIDSHIEDLIPQALATGLEIIQEGYDQIQNEMRFCIVI